MQTKVLRKRATNINNVEKCIKMSEYEEKSCKYNGH